MQVCLKDRVTQDRAVVRNTFPRLRGLQARGRFGRRSSFTVRDDDASHVHRPFDASSPAGLVLTFLLYCFVTRGSYVNPFHATCISITLLSDRSASISCTVDLERWRAHIPLQHQHL